VLRLSQLRSCLSIEHWIVISQWAGASSWSAEDCNLARVLKVEAPLHAPLILFCKPLTMQCARWLFVCVAYALVPTVGGGRRRRWGIRASPLFPGVAIVAGALP
jgi:hypothetical protein